MNRGSRTSARLLVPVLAVGLIATAVVLAQLPARLRTTPIYDPPVLAGRPLWGACAGGFSARHGSSVVVTSSGHCASEGTVGDSGGAVLVRGLPAGAVSRSFGGILGFGGAMGFTPLAEGLANLGLELCTTPDCGLMPPG